MLEVGLTCSRRTSQPTERLAMIAMDCDNQNSVVSTLADPSSAIIAATKTAPVEMPGFVFARATSGTGASPVGSNDFPTAAGLCSGEPCGHCNRRRGQRSSRKPQQCGRAESWCRITWVSQGLADERTCTSKEAIRAKAANTSPGSFMPQNDSGRRLLNSRRNLLRNAQRLR